MTVYSAPHVDNNTTVVFVNNLSSAGASIGLQPFPNGTSVEQATQTFEKAMRTNLETQFAKQFPSDSLNGNDDFGYAQPDADPGRPLTVPS